MEIGIIGAGNIGTVLARKFRRAGHDVRIANSRGPDTIRELAAEIGATPVEARDAVVQSEVVVVSIPQGRIPELAGAFSEGASDNVVIIDTGNYYPGVRDERIPAIEAGLLESQWVAQQLSRPLIKAFNSILARSLAEKGREAGEPGRIALPVAGDDHDAKSIAAGLVNDAGFDCVDAGTLADSWRQQPGTAAYCTDLSTEDLRRALAAADREGAPAKRDVAVNKVIQRNFQITNDEWVALNRATFGRPESVFGEL
jgi:predicted dinucleotide-binding enzyme